MKQIDTVVGKYLFKVLYILIGFYYFILVYGVEDFPYIGNISVKISVNPFVLYTRTSSTLQGVRLAYEINQHFLM